MAEAAKAAAELEAQAAIEAERVNAAVAEYNALRRTIRMDSNAFKSRHGREPKSLSECSARYRAAWKRRVELRREFPGRPWGDAAPAPAESSAPRRTTQRTAPPSAASNLAMSF